MLHALARDLEHDGADARVGLEGGLDEAPGARREVAARARERAPRADQRVAQVVRGHARVGPRVVDGGLERRDGVAVELLRERGPVRGPRERDPARGADQRARGRGGDVAGVARERREARAGLAREGQRRGPGGDVGVVFRAVRNGVCCCLESLYRGNHTKKERKNGQTFPFVCSTLVFQLCL